MVVIFDETERKLVKVCLTSDGRYLRIFDFDVDFASWLFTKCENDPHDGDPLDFLVSRFIEQRGPGPQSAEGLMSSYKYLGLKAPLRWVPTLPEWLNQYSIQSDEPNTADWIARVFLRSNKRDVTSSEISQTAELMRQLGFAPFGPDGPTTVKLLPSIPRVQTTVEPQDIQLPFPGTKVRR